MDPPPSRRPPLDLSLKSQLTFTSNHSFDQVEAAGTEPGALQPSQFDAMSDVNLQIPVRGLTIRFCRLLLGRLDTFTM